MFKRLADQLGKLLVRVGHALDCVPFIVPVALFLTLFVLSRWWFFADFPFPGVSPDSLTYWGVMQDWEAGRVPIFAVRPFAYPLFVRLTRLFTPDLLGLIGIQNILTAASCLTMIYAVQRVRPALSIFAALAMAGWATCSLAIEHDTQVLSDTLYASSLVFAFAFVLLGLVIRRGWLFALASFFMAWAILAKPAGLFLVVTFALLGAFMLWNRYSRREDLAFLIPLPVLLFLLALYNFLTIGVFTLSAFGESNIAMATRTFWETDPAFPANINMGIEKSDPLLALTAREREILKSSWEPAELQPLFHQGFSWNAYSEAVRVWSPVNANYTSEYAREWTRKVSFNAIQKHPEQYIKFVYTMLAIYYWGVTPSQQLNLQYSVMERAQNYLIDQRFKWDSNGIYWQMFPTPKFSPSVTANIKAETKNGKTEVTMADTDAWRVFQTLTQWRIRIFSNLWWVYAFFAVFLLAALRLLVSRFRHPGALFLLMLTTATIGASLIVALVEESLTRYSYVLMWTYYLAVVLSPLLFIPWRAPTSNPRASNTEK